MENCWGKYLRKGKKKKNENIMKTRGIIEMVKRSNSMYKKTKNNEGV